MRIELARTRERQIEEERKRERDMQKTETTDADRVSGIERDGRKTLFELLIDNEDCFNEL